MSADILGRPVNAQIATVSGLPNSLIEVWGQHPGNPPIKVWSVDAVDPVSHSGQEDATRESLSETTNRAAKGTV